MLTEEVDSIKLQTRQAISRYIQAFSVIDTKRLRSMSSQADKAILDMLISMEIPRDAVLYPSVINEARRELDQWVVLELLRRSSR